MIRIRFQNGADGREVLLDEKFETQAEAESQLAHLTSMYGTVPDAAAWIDGDPQPETPEPELDAEPPPGPAEATEVDLTGTIDDVLARYGDDATLAAQALEAENAADKPRKGLVDGLQKVIDDAEPPPGPAE